MVIKARRFYNLCLGGILWGCLLLWQCAALQRMANIQKPNLELQQVRFRGLSFEKLDVAFDVKIQNPNPLSMSLVGFDYDLHIGEASFLKGQQSTQQTIEAQGESVLEIPLTLRFDDLYNTFQVLKDKDSSDYKILCGLSFDLPILGKTRIPVTRSGRLPMLKLPSIHISGLQLKKLSLSSANLELKLKVNNTNTFQILMNQFNYDFLINGQRWARGLSSNPLQIKDKAESVLTIPISLDFLQMGRTVYNLLTGDQALNYQFQGDFRLDTSLPMLKQVSIPIERTGQLHISR